MHIHIHTHTQRPGAPGVLYNDELEYQEDTIASEIYIYKMHIDYYRKCLKTPIFADRKQAIDDNKTKL